MVVPYSRDRRDLLLATVERDAEPTGDATLLQSAATLSFAIMEFRNFNSNEVAPRAVAAGAITTQDDVQQIGSIPLPITLTMELERPLSKREAGTNFGIFSTRRSWKISKLLKPLG